MQKGAITVFAHLAHGPVLQVSLAPMVVISSFSHIVLGVSLNINLSIKFRQVACGRQRTRLLYTVPVMAPDSDRPIAVVSPFNGLLPMI